MTTEEIMQGLKNAVEKRDGALMASLFTEDGVYHDVFYGAFHGKQKIRELIETVIYQVADDMRWDFFNPVSDGRNMYAAYTYSYVSTLPEAKGRRVGFEGTAIMRLENGLLKEYREIANTGPCLLDIGFPPERVAKILGRQNAQLKARPEWARHRT